ncbi:transposase [Maliponia aquimaris]|uniref:transposase n=1 Tax=Maliponia aquimaris TaxID=1673631 RepID=UPI001595EA59|nr:transposase [Maliponia aquimaris]
MAPKQEAAKARFDLTDFEWRLIQPLLPNTLRGAARVDDRRGLNGIFWMLRTGAPWRDLPAAPRVPTPPPTTVFNRWTKVGAWAQVFETFAEKPPGSMRYIDSSIIRAHQQAEAHKTGRITPLAGLASE